MLHTNDIKLLGLNQYIDSIDIDACTVTDSVITASVRIKHSTPTICSRCNLEARFVIKDYITTTVQHSIDLHRPVYLSIKRPRYKCKLCGKTFQLPNPLLVDTIPSLTKETVLSVLVALQTTDHSFNEIANAHFISNKLVAKIFQEYVSFGKGIPSKYICIDEKCYKHGDTKFALVILDFKTSKVIELCKDRRKSTLVHWLRDMRNTYIKPTEVNSPYYKNPLEIKLFCIDMNQYYYDAIKLIFPKVPVAINSFHLMSNIMKALNNVRARVMKKYYKADVQYSFQRNKPLDQDTIDARQPTEYKSLKKYWRLISYCGPTKATDEKKHNSILGRNVTNSDVLDYCLSIDSDLKLALSLKELYYDFNKTATLETAPDRLDGIINEFNASGLKGFVELAGTLSYWRQEIINSFMKTNDGRRISNGPMEGMNSKIEKIIVNSNGLPKFDTLRNRVLLRYGKTNGFKIK